MSGTDLFGNRSVRHAQKHVRNLTAFSLLVAHLNLAELAGKCCDTDQLIRNGAVNGCHAQPTHQFVFIWSKPSAFGYAKQMSLLKTVTEVCTPGC